MKLALTLLFWSVSCTPHAQYPGNPRMIYHADVRFSEDEKHIVQQTIAQWNEHMNGARSLSVVFDWHGQNIEPRIEAGEPSDARIPGVPVAPEGQDVAGFCLGGRIVWITRRTEVLTHEIGHSLGMRKHHPSENRVMSAVTQFGQTWQTEDQEYCIREIVCRAKL